ncbi:hypothetical protein FRC02_002285 [Tulasnella sp. 418]|nr:hypothetical protein FRC02_002285 [Tulasnella sp. 418]
MIPAASVENLKLNVKGIVTQPGDEDYTVSRWSYFAEKSAQFVVFPRDVEDVSTAVKFVREHNLDIAIRGGGHASGGQSSSEGLVIDFSKYMNGASVDPKAKTARVEGGCKGVTLERETIQHSLGATLGTCSQVGVVGHLIGGGIGLSIGQYGLALDNLISATVVLADGDVVTANENEHPDLFWGIRGGGGSFGIITEMEIRLHDQRPDLYACTFIYSPDKLPEVIEELSKWRSGQQVDEFISVVFSLNPQKNPVIVLSAYKNSDRSSGEAAFQRFGVLGPLMQMPKQLPFEQFSSLSDPFVSGVSSRLPQGVYIKALTLEIAQAAWDAWHQLVTTTSASASIIMFEHYHYDKLASIASDATAYVHRTKDMMVCINLNYPDRSTCSASEAKKHALEIKHIIDAKANADEPSLCGYPLYADPYSSVTDTDEYARAVFGNNYPRLQEIKKRYDPDQVFNKWFPIRPA